MRARTVACATVDGDAFLYFACRSDRFRVPTRHSEAHNCPQCQVPVSEIDSDAMRCDWKSSLGYKENNTTPSAREKTRKRRVTRKEQKQDGQFCRGTHSPLHREVSVPTASTTQYLDRASCWIARFLECAPELWRVPSSTAMQQ